jgi:hypothetical protein
MQYYKAPNGTLHALPVGVDPDDVQGFPEGCVAITDAERDALVKAANPLTAQKLLSALAAEYEQRMNQISSSYPQSERESWPVQTAEARALIASASASTPWIDAASAARGVTRSELATRIVSKDNAYRAVSGAMTGVRQKFEDQITAAAGNQTALESIDITKGWPL